MADEKVDGEEMEEAEEESVVISEWVQQHCEYLEAPTAERDIDVIRDFVDGVVKKPRAVQISTPLVRMEMSSVEPMQSVDFALLSSNVMQRYAAVTVREQFAVNDDIE